MTNSVEDETSFTYVQGGNNQELEGTNEKFLKQEGALISATSSDGEMQRYSQGFEDSGFPTSEKAYKEQNSSFQNETYIDRKELSSCCQADMIEIQTMDLKSNFQQCTLCSSVVTSYGNRSLKHEFGVETSRRWNLKLYRADKIQKVPTDISTQEIYLNIFRVEERKEMAEQRKNFYQPEHNKHYLKSRQQLIENMFKLGEKLDLC